MPNRLTATDGEKRNDSVIQNDSGCCVYVPLPESPVKLVPLDCNEPCPIPIENDCGIVTPDGSGTLAGCKSTTLPHFGIVMNKRTDTCRRFGYYTSGNTEEYENECGAIDRLKHTVKQVPCSKEIIYTVDSCDCFDSRAADAITDANQNAKITAIENKNTAQDASIASNTAKNTAQDTEIANNTAKNATQDTEIATVTATANQNEADIASNHP